MLSLVVTDLTGTKHVLELYANEPIRLNYQASEIKDISSIAGSYSQSFRLPATAVNKAFFGGFSEPGIHTSSDGSINGKFSVKKKVEALLVQDTIPVMEGYVQVMSAIIMGGRQPDYQVTFFGETPAFGAELSGKVLTDLTTTAIDQDVTYANVTGSWTGADADDHSVRWGLLDKGQNLNFSNDFDSSLYQADLVPYLSLHWIWNKIFSEAGFSYTSTWIDSNIGEFKKMYMPLWNGSLTPLGDEVPEDEICAAVLSSAQNITSQSYQVVNLIDNSSSFGGYDPGLNFNNTTHAYTIPYTGYYTIEYACVGSGQPFQAALTIDGAEVDGTILSNFGGQSTGTVQLLFEGGELLRLEAKNGTFAGNTIYPAGVGFTTQGAWMVVREISMPLSGYEVELNRNFPEMKQLDFITSLQKMFNLVMYPSKADPKNLIVEPYPIWADTGTEKDWTSKLDLSKDIVLEPTTKVQSAKYLWRHQAGNDVINKGVEEQLQRGYTEFKVLDPDNDFATGETEIRTGFVPHASNTIPSATGAVFKGIDEAGLPIKKAQPLVAYWNGALSGMGSWSLKNDSSVAQNQVTMPIFSMRNAFPSTVTSHSLEYKAEFQFHIETAYPLNTLYYSYWSRYANELYSSQARFMTCFLYLTPKDISTFVYSDKILVENQYWRVMKIEGYDPTASKSCKVQLKLILDDIDDCAFTPSAVTDNGIITFTNQAGTTGLTGSQTCCEKYGYTWVTRKAEPFNSCVQPTITLDI